LATVLEEPTDRPVDVFANDTTTLTPLEVSRVHCKIYHEARLLDFGQEKYLR
jgi:hypothetical protein